MNVFKSKLFKSVFWYQYSTHKFSSNCCSKKIRVLDNLHNAQCCQFWERYLYILHTTVGVPVYGSSCETAFL